MDVKLHYSNLLIYKLHYIASCYTNVRIYYYIQHGLGSIKYSYSASQSMIT